MQTTSHFIGITLKTTYFPNLFTSLQRYLKENDVEDILTLQNFKSLHLTLYYLEKEIPPKDLIQIKNTIVSLNQKYKNFVITVDHVGYFQKDNPEILGYLTLVQQESLQLFNNQIAAQYKRDFIQDNKYPYVPHISLFTVKNTSLFQQHRDAIENMIEESLVKLHNKKSL